MHSVWQKTATGAIPADPNAERIYNRTKVGAHFRMDDPVTVRSPAQLRLYWALMDVACDNQSIYADAEELSDAVKCELGYCHTIVRPNGDRIQRPKSIALGNMSAEKFNAFFEAVLELLARTLGVTTDDLRREASDSTLPRYIREGTIAP